MKSQINYSVLGIKRYRNINNPLDFYDWIELDKFNNSTECINRAKYLNSISKKYYHEPIIMLCNRYFGPKDVIPLLPSLQTKLLEEWDDYQFILTYGKNMKERVDILKTFKWYNEIYC